MKFARIYLIYFLIFIFGAAIVARLVFLQIINGELYRALAKGQQEIFQEISGKRGEIFFQDKGKPVLVATNKSAQFCYASPKIIQNKEKAAELLAPILGIDKKDLFERLSENADKLFLLIKRNVTPEEAQKIAELKFQGIYLNEELRRYYPYGSLASDILGFVNKDGQGQYGVEGYWNDVLTGREGWQRVEYGPFGRFLKGDSDSSIKGADLILTIDKNIQAQAEKLLSDFSEKFGFKSAQIIVIEPQTGRTLALVDFPAFNPNKFQEYAQSELRLFQNGAIQSLYEPGSIFKVITMAAALNEGKVTPETTYEDKGYIIIGRRKITNYDERVWGKRTMTEVLEKSINTGAVFAQSQLSHQVFTNYLDRFGIFKKTNIDLQGEACSENKEFKKGWEVNYATASFGQGIEMNLMQIARAYCAIANKGRLVQPYIVEEVAKNGRKEKLHSDKTSYQVISSQTARELTKMLVSVAENGYSRTARVSGYYVAGKTGTSQIPYSVLGMNKSGYSDQTWQSFVGFAPAFDPKFVIAIKLDNPKTRTASESATFIFKDLAKYILDYCQIPPDKES